MASDNLLAGAAGFAEGLQGVLVPYLKMQQEAKIKSQLDAQKSAESKISVKDLRAITGQQFTGMADTDLIDKALVPYFTKQELGTTNVFGPHGESLGQVKGGVTQLKEPDSTKKDKEAQSLQDRLDEIDSVLADVGSLRGKYNNSLTGKTGAAVNMLQHIPLIGGTIAPDTKTYKDTVDTTALNIQKVLTKSGRALGSGMKAEAIALPTIGETTQSGNPKFNEVERKLNERKNSILTRLGRTGELVDLSKYGAGASASGGGNQDDLMQQLISEHK